VLAANQITRSIYLYRHDQIKAEWQKNGWSLGKILAIEPRRFLDELEKAGYESSCTKSRVLSQCKPEAFVALAERAAYSGLEIQSMPVVFTLMVQWQPICWDTLAKQRKKM
jgi:hypothetical protein